MNEDNISPSHYQRGGFQTTDVILAWGLGYCLGNVIKYICRAGHKTDNPVEDLEKAKWYLEKEIDKCKQA